MPFLPHNQQHQSIEGINSILRHINANSLTNKLTNTKTSYYVQVCCIQGRPQMLHWSVINKNQYFNRVRSSCIIAKKLTHSAETEKVCIKISVINLSTVTRFYCTHILHILVLSLFLGHIVMHSIRCRLVCLYVCHELGLYKLAETIKKLFSGQMQGGQETMYYMGARIPQKKWHLRGTCFSLPMVNILNIMCGIG